MLAYVVRRLAQAVLILFLLSVGTFLLIHALPGGPVRAILGPRASKAVVQAFEHENGFDRPVVSQYLTYMNNLFHGNFGYSYKLNQPVRSLFAQDLPKSAALVGPAILLSLAIGIPMGVVQALRRDKIDDHVLTGVSFVLYAMPDNWLAFVLIDAFAFHLLHLSPIAPQDPTWRGAFTDWPAMVLPWATLSLTSIAGYSRYMRSSALDALGQDFIRTARAKGASASRVVWRHVLRNASLPIITLVGLSLPGLFGGAIIEETVFNYPGIGLAFENAALTKDYPILLGTTIVLGALVILGNLMADIAYAMADPRVRLS